MEHVELFLNHIGLGQCAESLLDHACDSLDIFFTMDDWDFQTFGPHVGMLPGHVQRLKNAVYKMKKASEDARQRDIANTLGDRVPIIDLSSGPNTNNNPTNDNGPAAAAAASALTFVSAAEHAGTSGPTKRKSSDNIPRVVATAKQARLASLRHSTQEGSSAMKDPKSGSRRLVYRCTSVLSKKVKKSMGPEPLHPSQQCKYCLYWSRNKDKTWALRPEKSVMEHSSMCPAPQRVTRDELIHDSKFVQHTLNHLNVTGKTAADAATSSGGRLDGSVSKRTAKRASNDVKRFHDKDYKEDWSKLRQWGREYEQKNRNSRFRLQINEDTNRCVKGPIGH